MKRIHLLGSGIFLALAISGCNQDNIIQVGENPFEPIVLTSEQKAVVQANNQFALNYLAEVEKASESCDFIVSPLSAGYLLGMMLNGAEGKLAEEIKSALGFENQGIDAVNEFYGQLIHLLPQMDKATTVSSARGLFPSLYLQFYDDFKTVANSIYLAETEIIDYSKPQNAVDKLNNWCSSKTNGTIQNMFSLNEVHPNTVLILTDVNYFNGAWSEYFDKSKTAGESFTKENGSIVQIPFMKKKANYGVNATGTTVHIPYGNGAFSMAIILPERGKKTQSVIQSLQQRQWNPSNVPFEVDLWLPRFEISTEISLIDVLSNMGIPSIKQNGAFSQLAYDLDLKDTGLSMRQKTAIRVNEQGTEASTVSEANFFVGALPSSGPLVFHADRPFIYLIYENSTGAILYAGCFRGESK